MKRCLFIFLSIPLVFSSFAQDNTKSGESSISLNFSGVPVVNITGTDTSYQNALSISPVFDLRSKSGWGITYSPSLVTSGQKTGIYVHSLSAGYERYGKKNFDIAFNYTRYIFTDKTSVPYSPINNEIYFSLAFTKPWLKPFFATSIGFGKDSANVAEHDIGLAAGISHGFSWEDKGIFSLIELTPSLSLNGGTNDFFSLLTVSRYISHSHNFAKYVKRGGKGKRANTPVSFELSNFELNMETNFEIGSFSIHPSGSVFLPVSSGTDNSVYGYAQISVQYHF
ncbi:MAG: hypothetical protein Q8941_04360 [Bacteroidota bacterium]|nr:hypothetical protein [Bacteroidota bacterium]